MQIKLKTKSKLIYTMFVKRTEELKEKLRKSYLMVEDGLKQRKILQQLLAEKDKFVAEMQVKLSTLEKKVQEVTLKEKQMNENKKSEEIDKNMVVKLVDKYEKLKAVHIQKKQHNPNQND